MTASNYNYPILVMHYDQSLVSGPPMWNGEGIPVNSEYADISPRALALSISSFSALRRGPRSRTNSTAVLIARKSFATSGSCLAGCPTFFFMVIFTTRAESRRVHFHAFSSAVVDWLRKASNMSYLRRSRKLQDSECSAKH